MSTSDICKICKDSESTKSNDDNDACDVTDVLQNLSTGDEVVSICANCGKEGDDVNNICNRCKLVKYCNAACKKKHRSKHKKQCERRVAELHDEKLFKQPPPKEDCPICFLLLPLMESGWRYYVCCGKVICGGCCYAPVYDNQGNIVEKKCSFCRTLLPTTDEELISRYKKRMKAGDPIAIYNLGIYYRNGMHGLPQDYTKALELLHRAAELGCTEAYCNIGIAYDNGKGVEIDATKARYYFELAAMMGNETARYNLGIMEKNAGNFDRALRHYMIAVRSGDDGSLNQIQKYYSVGLATKDDYTKALQSYQAYLGEIKSAQRDEAAADDEDYRYY